ncbi:hypothetical protein A3D04_00185 [Candidatus Curtissbacteria bacterium RIFCSPHIGHO2_02_FULL_40_16b]|uniref:Type II secretion system protein GspG C-terminal domain-containing protein n=1 Tax=Candidatus Curtissbacteria bacterium RIFCSPHIGHO2_02_FULL_40_16b TaxID=1797714 RepID=A0A1F5G8W2_9BACT|nr:MAG: hypothetical protein A3D04_00185 [Candidatus Curtissbacteria bacterium RIFCSPHIGHO2_02_FULL_40_16b]
MSFPAPLTKLTPIPYSLNPKRGFTTIGSHDRGFTLTEVLLAIAIVTILTVIGISLINPAKRITQTRDAQRKKDISDITEALGFYLAAKETHPLANRCDSSIGANTSLDCWDSLFPEGTNWTSGAPSYIFDGLIIDQQILKDLPVDPKNNKEFHYRYKKTVPVGSDVSYYWIGAKLENPEDPIKWVFRCTDMYWLTPNPPGCMVITPATSTCFINKDCWQE